jgi:hydrogenase maturation protease
MKNKKRILILGYGNPLRGDDALGPRIAEEIAERFEGNPRVKVQTVHQLTLDLAETFAKFSLIILIDARNAEPVGEIFHQKIQPSQKLPQPFSHYLNPPELLGVCQLLYGAPPVMILTGINAASFEVGAPISRAVAVSLPELVDHIETILMASLREW